MKKIAIGLIAASLLGACASTPAPKTVATTPAKPAAENNAAANSAANAAKSNAASDSQVKSAALPAHLDPANMLAQKRSVYFDFDRYTVKPEFAPIVDAHAKYLGANRATRIKIEGSADERGSREYNLALGQKRAEAVKKLMVLTGAGESQVEVISWGKEKPKALGHDEAAWAENRRADIAYPDDKK